MSSNTNCGVNLDTIILFTTVFNIYTDFISPLNDMHACVQNAVTYTVNVLNTMSL